MQLIQRKKLENISLLSFKTKEKDNSKNNKEKRRVQTGAINEVFYAKKLGLGKAVGRERR